MEKIPEECDNCGNRLKMVVGKCNEKCPVRDRLKMETHLRAVINQYQEAIKELNKINIDAIREKFPRTKARPIRLARNRNMIIELECGKYIKVNSEDGRNITLSWGSWSDVWLKGRNKIFKTGDLECHL